MACTLNRNVPKFVLHTQDDDSIWLQIKTAYCQGQKSNTLIPNFRQYPTQNMEKELFYANFTRILVSNGTCFLSSV